jgi:hypothetical protein
MTQHFDFFNKMSDQNCVKKVQRQIFRDGGSTIDYHKSIKLLLLLTFCTMFDYLSYLKY